MLWAKTYSGGLRDVLALQSEVAAAIAYEIEVKLTPQEQARLTAPGVVDPEAYEAFLKGRYHWARRNPATQIVLGLPKRTHGLERAAPLGLLSPARPDEARHSFGRVTSAITRKNSLRSMSLLSIETS
jgi:hypothetical protein